MALSCFDTALTQLVSRLGVKALPAIGEAIEWEDGPVKASLVGEGGRVFRFSAVERRDGGDYEPVATGQFRVNGEGVDSGDEDRLEAFVEIVALARRNQVG